MKQFLEEPQVEIPGGITEEIHRGIPGRISGEIHGGMSRGILRGIPGRFLGETPEGIAAGISERMDHKNN